MNADANIPRTEPVLSPLVDILAILGVATELYISDTRIAYLCFRGALEEASRLDDHEDGGRVGQFITSAISWIERDNNQPPVRKQPSDEHEMIRFYLDNYKKHIQGKNKSTEDHSAPSDSLSPPLKKACKTALILYKVLELLWKGVPLPSEIKDVHTDILTFDHDSPGENVPDSELVPSSLAEISSILRVANDIYNPTDRKISYLCFYGALEALNLDRIAGGHVGHFMTSVIRWIKTDVEKPGREILRHRDKPLLENFYLTYYEKNIKAPANVNQGLKGKKESNTFAPEPSDSSQRKQACKTALILYKVFKLLWKGVQLPRKITDAHTQVEKLAQSFGILPLDPDSPGEDFPDSELVPSALAEISSILRVANDIYSYNRPIGYLCVWGALNQALDLDFFASGHGVRQFITKLFSWLQRNDKPTGKANLRHSDAPNMESFYLDYYDTYVFALTKDLNVDQDMEGDTTRVSDSDSDIADSSHKITKACQSALVLYKVLEVIWKELELPSEKKITDVHTRVEKLAQIFKPYNIIPLDFYSNNHAIRELAEIKDVVTALGNNKSDLKWPEHHKDNNSKDMLDWLQAKFGFQRDNVSNQREHLILLLANVQSRQLPNEQESRDQLFETKTLDIVMDKLLGNYKKWCMYLDIPNNLRSRSDNQQEVEPQCKLLYIGLYLLIWGEAANIRFMPECLCYIFHHMAGDLLKMLHEKVTKTNTETETVNPVNPAYGSGDEAFLKEVVEPIYQTIYMEAKRGSKGNHSQWRNYDDLNEYFWLPECSQLDWPIKKTHAFFTTQNDGHQSSNTAGSGHMGKVNFVETRSFFHLFRNFGRMWTFYILCLLVMVLIACDESGELWAIFYGKVFTKRIFQDEIFLNVLSIFITITAALEFTQAILDICLSWKARHSMTFYVKIRNILKALVAASIPITYFLNLVSDSQFSLLILIYLVLKIPSVLPFFLQRLEYYDFRLVRLLMRLCQPPLFIGSGMYETIGSCLKYTAFWIAVLFLKFIFSYRVEIQPLIGPTEEILRLRKSVDHLSELFSLDKCIGLVITLWSPVLLVYFMDTQIWYAIVSTLVGGFIGASTRLGEVQTLGMLKSRFQFLSRFSNDWLVPMSDSSPTEVVIDQKKLKETRFHQMWNTIITSFRQEDLINDRDKDLLLVPDWKKLNPKNEQVPDQNEDEDFIRWPLFLLTDKIHMVLEMAKDSSGDYRKLKEALDSDIYMRNAVEECYACFKIILNTLFYEEPDLEALAKIFTIIDDARKPQETEKTTVNWSALPDLYVKFVQLIEQLRKPRELFSISRIMLNMLGVAKSHMTEEEFPELKKPKDHLYFIKFRFPLAPLIEDWEQNINRLYLLLTVKYSAMDVPSNLEARRRLTFFSNSLFMKMPRAPKISNMLSFSVLTPYSSEDVLFSNSALEDENEDGVSILFYLQKVFPDEWKNFLERVNGVSKEKLGDDDLKNKLCMWASHRGQTLARTVRGMMYYRKALVLQALFDLAKDEEGYKALMELSESGSPLWARCQAHADIKFTYVVSYQHYSKDKRSGNQRAKDILTLMTTYPSLRVAYIDEVEQVSRGLVGTKTYYSVLVKSDPQQKEREQVIYRIKLPGDPMIGEFKPGNQNHSIIFTRGEALQTIDMNQDNYMEEAFKMRNLLEEFQKMDGKRLRTILGVREHIFTGSVSSLAWFMSNQETSFVTLGQRVLANPLKVRFHYGHPDVFDRLFHITRGGVSKASKTLNLSEDIFAGFNSTLREGSITHHEYIQVGKGRDMGLNQISKFEAKIANGSGEQTLSRDLYRLSHRFDFFRMMSCYFTTVGFYFCSMLTVLTVYVFLYGRLYLILSGLEQEMLNHPAIRDTASLQAAIASESAVQIGLLMAFPMIMVIGLEKGFLKALFDLVLMQLQLAPVFFTFQLGTKAHYYCKTLLHGGAEYMATGRGFVVVHVKFVDNYMMYSRSHFVKAFELMVLLLVYHLFGHAYMGVVTYLLITFSIWFMVASWLFAPFLFNPSGFEWHKFVDDWKNWKKWIYDHDFAEMGVPSEDSWVSWWDKEQEHLQQWGKRGIAIEFFLAFRFFIVPYGLVNQLTLIENYDSKWVVHVVSWLPLILVTLIVKLSQDWGKKNRGGTESHFIFRFIKVFVVLVLLAILIIIIASHIVTPKDIFLCLAAFILNGWGVLLIAQALSKYIGQWSFVKTLAWSYDLLMGGLLFIPIAFFSWFPFMSEFQTRILFNQAFSRGLQISHILGGQSSAENKE